jgi:hypothetical protein
MIVLKILGAIDLTAAFAFLLLIFGIEPFLQFILFCSGLLLLKGMFVLTGDILSVIDVLASLILILAIFFTLPPIILWTPAFLLLAKGLVSFL